MTAVSNVQLALAESAENVARQLEQTVPRRGDVNREFCRIWEGDWQCADAGSLSQLLTAPAEDAARRLTRQFW